VALALSAAAAYHVGGDTVAVDVWLEDPTAGVFKPQEVELGTVDLLLATEDVILASAAFDRRHGTGPGDGAFHAFFLHPAAIRDLKARVTVETFNDGPFRTEVPVVPVTDAAVPLDPQRGNR
jgi:hypothetical protein